MKLFIPSHSSIQPLQTNVVFREMSLKCKVVEADKALGIAATQRTTALSLIERHDGPTRNSERIAPRITANGEAAVQGVVQMSQNVSFTHREPVQIRS